MSKVQPRPYTLARNPGQVWYPQVDTGPVGGRDRRDADARAEERRGRAGQGDWRVARRRACRSTRRRSEEPRPGARAAGALNGGTCATTPRRRDRLRRGADFVSGYHPSQGAAHARTVVPDTRWFAGRRHSRRHRSEVRRTGQDDHRIHWGWQQQVHHSGALDGRPARPGCQVPIVMRRCGFDDAPHDSSIRVDGRAVHGTCL
jgi:hypothetical protein